jgi:hypothetical protein
MISFLPCPVRESETVKDLKAAALQPVGLAIEYLRAAFVDYPGVDTTACHPRSQHQTLGGQQCLSHHLLFILTQLDRRRRSIYPQISICATPILTSPTRRIATQEAP